MAQKKKVTARVYRQDEIAVGIYDMWIETELAKDAKPGQFISVYPKNQATLLPRPISICEVNEEKTMLRIVYRVAGSGTAEFSNYHTGADITILGTLGNGFPLEKADGKRVFLMGGGIGIPPMLQLSKELSARGKAEKISAVLGYRNELFLCEDFKLYADLYVATEDGSSGSKGTVMNAIEDNDLKGDVIFACGPMPMLRAIKQFAEANQMKAYISLEERMACGVGACLGCVCTTKEVDHHSHVKNARVCTDGPVYDAKEVMI
ncbi:MAG: dihydroorotate dehydrogenase electron transfer subunit [Lachnospiraceae bacterium]|nr:dihydroorotate dehydrogenase electron transfer subunit [Lachnospiraceae bacterium]